MRSALVVAISCPHLAWRPPFDERGVPWCVHDFELLIDHLAKMARVSQINETYLVCLGDLYRLIFLHNHVEIALQNEVVRILSKACESFWRIVLITGNHDVAASRQSALTALESPQITVVGQVPRRLKLLHGSYELTGLSWLAKAGHFDAEAWLAAVKAITDEKTSAKRILLTHAEVKDVATKYDHYTSKHGLDLQTMLREYFYAIVCGHHHRGCKALDNAYFPGSMLHTSFGEARKMNYALSMRLGTREELRLIELPSIGPRVLLETIKRRDGTIGMKYPATTDGSQMVYGKALTQPVPTDAYVRVIDAVGYDHDDIRERVGACRAIEILTKPSTRTVDYDAIEANEDSLDVARQYCRTVDITEQGFTRGALIDTNERIMLGLDV